MSILSEILDISSEKLVSVEVPRQRAKLLLRWTLFLTLLGLGATTPGDLLDTFLVNLILVLFFAVNVVVSFLPWRLFRSTPVEFSLGLLDTALISYVVFQADATGYLCLFFFLLLITTAASSRFPQFLLGSFVLSSLYLLLTGIRGGWLEVLSIQQLMILPLFYSAALYFGYQALEIRQRHAMVDRVYRERQELKVVLNILESITSSLDFHAVMFQIASRIAEVVDAIRCSILLVEEGVADRAYVVAANDDRRVKMLPMDLTKYPEVQLAIQKKRAVIIEDVEQSDLLRPHVEELLRLHFHSLIVLPILYQDAVIGTLFLRASRKRSFSNEEIKFCRVVASAAASAIKNSMLYRALEEHAREQEATGERLRLLFDNSPDLILHLDREGTIREANLAVERLSGRSRTELLGQPATGLFRGLPPMPVLRDRLREAERPVAYEAKLLAQDGEERNLSVTAGAVVNTRDGVILIGRDVTEQNRATMLLQQTEKLSSIGEIVASVAHELNNPLSGVLGFSQLLAQKDSEGRFKRDIERIVECADRCQKIVQNLLSFARPFTPEKKPLGLNGVLDKTLDLLERPLQADNIEVVREYAPDLPFVLADFHQVQQVFTNLITNAHQAMTADKGQGRLVLRTTSRDGRVHVEVRDDGPGIPPDVLPRIFDPFFSTKGQGRGTGLGLSVSYGILRDHGGELRVDTRVGGGTSFTVVLPIHSTAADTAAPRPAMAAGTSGGKRILVVDDEEVIVELYVQLLQALGHSIDTASTGLEALRKIEQNTYDLVISDIKMPKMNGIQLFEKAALAKPGMRNRFIFITGDMNSLTSQQFSTITDHPCLIKPVNIEKIESTIRELLGDRTAGADSPVSVN